jgi:hypothetical protein
MPGRTGKGTRLGRARRAFLRGACSYCAGVSSATLGGKIANQSYSRTLSCSIPTFPLGAAPTPGAGFSVTVSTTNNVRGGSPFAFAPSGYKIKRRREQALVLLMSALGKFLIGHGLATCSTAYKYQIKSERCRRPTDVEWSCHELDGPDKSFTKNHNCRLRGPFGARAIFTKFIGGVPWRGNERRTNSFRPKELLGATLVTGHPDRP